MFGNLGSRNFFEVPQLNWFSSPVGSQSPADAHAAAMSGNIKVTDVGRANVVAMQNAFSGKDYSGSGTTAAIAHAKKQIFNWTPKDYDINYHVKGVRPTDFDTQKAIADHSPLDKIITIGKNKTHIFTHQMKNYQEYTVVTPIIHTKGMNFETGQKQIYHETIRAREHKKKTETLREQAEAKAKATEDFLAKWGSVGRIGTATQTNIVQALLASNNLHQGTDTTNLVKYLEERDYDISAIIAGEETIPDDIFKPVKQTELRETAQVLKTQDENVIREVIEKTYGVSGTPQNVSRTTKGTTPEKKIQIPIGHGSTRDILPLILIFAAGVIGVYFIIRRLKK